MGKTTQRGSRDPTANEEALSCMKVPEQSPVVESFPSSSKGMCSEKDYEVDKRKFP